MESFQILSLSLALLFGLGLLFSILLWCRSWRREEREAYGTTLKHLTTEVSRLREAVELLDGTAASLRTADGQLSDQLDHLQRAVARLQRSAPSGAGIGETRGAEPAKAVGERLPRGAPAQKSAPVEPPPEREISSSDASGAPVVPAEPGTTSRVKQLLAEGRSEVEVAKSLDLGLAEVRMIARLVALE